MLHLERSFHVIRAELLSIQDLQRAYGGADFEKTLKRIEDYYNTLAQGSGDASPPVEPARARFLEIVGALRLFLGQLERLHSIAFADAKRHQEADEFRRNWFLVPLAAIIVLVGAFAFRYATRQIGAALNQVEQAERELQLLNADLEQRVEARTAELRAAQEKLVRSERLATLGQLTATVSHELRNPMGAMRNSVAVVRKLAVDGESLTKESLDIIDRSIGRCDAIIADLLDYTRNREPNLTLTAVDDWLAEVLDEYDLPSGSVLDKDLQAGVKLAIDQQRFRRVMLNIIDNACHAMAPKAECEEKGNGENGQRLLRVATRSAKGRLEVSIRDSGPGVPPENVENIFEPLFSTKSFGVGLGLPMVKQIMEQHAGGIEVSSAAGQGAEFTLWLPLNTGRQRTAS